MEAKLNNWKVLVGLIVVGILLAVGLLIFLVEEKEAPISLSSNVATLQIGDSWTIKVSTEEGTTPPKVAFSSANASIATVDKNGKVTGVREGETYIRCTTEGGQSKTVKITVGAEKTDNEVIYLTYESGPSREVTPALLALLQKYKAKATFFPYGQEAEAYSEPVKQAAEEGHTVGVHTYMEDYSGIYESIPAFVDDFKKTEKIIRKITGKKPEYWRFPGGSVNDKVTPEDKEIIMETLHERGYVCVDWTCYVDDMGDTEHDSKTMCDTALRTIDQAISMGRTPVVRMHDSTDNGQTLVVTEKILKHYGKKGFRFRAISSYTGGDIIAGE